MKKLMALGPFLFCLIFSWRAFALNPDFFPVDNELRTRVEFWKKIYTVVNSFQGFLHDSNDLSVIYEVVDVSGKTVKQQNKFIKQRKERIKNILLSIAYKNKENLTEEESQYFLSVAYKRPDEIRTMAENLRWQRGMSDRFRQGVLDSYLYLDHIKKIFKDEGVPEEVAYLPHVESSFNYRAYSKVGAAGIFQFMRSTARLYRLKMNYVVDERLDPLLSARAAARLLKSNYEKLGAWPLAITAYNHGPHGMERAARSLSTTNISEIIKNYEGSRFGFASQNFYACFVASYELAQNPEKYFGSLILPKSLQFTDIELERPTTLKQLVEISGVDAESIKDFNRAIRPVAFNSRVPIPKGTKIHLPVGIDKSVPIASKLSTVTPEAISSSETFEEHRVTAGESLYTIAKLYKVALNDLIEANKIVNPKDIRIGDKLKIPLPVNGQNNSIDKKKIPVASAAPIATPLPNVTPTPTINVVDKNLSQPGLPDDIIKSYNFDLKKIDEKTQYITVEVNESLSQYAEWLNRSLEEIRKLNRLNRNGLLRIGQRLKVPLKDEEIYEFNLKRVQYHMALEEDFYSNYKISDVEMYKVTKGETLMVISEKKQIPLWLLRKYVSLDKKIFRPGQLIGLPKIIPLDNSKGTPLDVTNSEN